MFRQLVEEVVSGRENAKLSQQKLQQYKADFVKQYKEEHKQMMKQALEEVSNLGTIEPRTQTCRLAVWDG